MLCLSQGWLEPIGLTSVWQLPLVEEGSSMGKGLEQRAEQSAEEEEEVGAARLLAELEEDRQGEGRPSAPSHLFLPRGLAQHTLKYRPSASSKLSLSLSVKSPLGFHSSFAFKRFRPVSQAKREAGV